MENKEAKKVDYKLDKIIELMNKALTDTSFNTLVVGNFLSVKSEFTKIDSLSNKILQLAEYAYTHQQIPKLLEKIQNINPRVYQEYAPLLENGENTPPISLNPIPDIPVKGNGSLEEVGICDILVLAANTIPTNTTTKKLELDHEIKLILNEAIKYTIKTPSQVCIEDLSKYLIKFDPIILHFSGHGNSRGEIILNNRDGQEQVLPIEELAKLLSNSRVECVVLNACYSGEKVDPLIKVVSCVIGMTKEIEDKSALKFAEGFYRGLGQGKSYYEAFELGRSQINLLGLPDADVPHIIPRDTSVLDLKPERKRNILKEEKQLLSYPLWFGTNRKPVDVNDISQGFSGERDTKLHYGTCNVIVPKFLDIGSTEPAFWQKLFGTRVDSFKLQKESLSVFNEENKFWSNITKTLNENEYNERYALIFIHGFNVSFESAALRAAQLGVDLKIPPGMMAFYSWPSKAKLERYTADEATIEASEKYISKFLMDWVQKVQEKEIEKVHIIAHSMGNRGLLRVMQRIFDQLQTKSKVSFGQIFLAAPDVDPDLFKDLAEAYRNLAERTTLYVSSKDKALASSGIIHDYPRLGFLSSSEEITVIEGIDTVEVSNIDLTWLGHGYYGAARDVLNDIHCLLKDNKSPDKRFGLKEENLGNKQYWIIRK
ncbi:MAG: alpha/beta hydrolase [Dolichospermum circinale Clear-D4]|nr:alpha/beta hydrolase [Dolichospermum circinale Clear-D4]